MHVYTVILVSSQCMHPDEPGVKLEYVVSIVSMGRECFIWCCGTSFKSSSKYSFYVVGSRLCFFSSSFVCR